MSRIGWLAVGVFFLVPAMAAEPAQQARPPAQELDFSPPPVPEFMLRRPGKPLTLEEMQKQADEASRRAREERARRSAPPDKSAADSPGTSK